MSGWPQPDQPSGKITLILDQPSTLNPDEDLRNGLSAIVRQDRHLWVANDETTSIERLMLEDDGQARAHHSFDLTDLLELPGDEGEIDIEGLDLDLDGEHLWLIGSHSAVRKRVKGNAQPPEARKSLATVEVSSRRRVLARLSPQTHLDPNNSPAAPSSPPAVFGLGRGTTDLITLLADDPHLADFVRSSTETSPRPIPGKDNGLDCEGLAVRGDRVFIGLRGPVLRGWAIIVELAVDGGPTIEPQPIGAEGRRYRKHFLNLRGLGVRDLCRHGDDLLVLAGPTMELDGRTAVFRWRDALTSHDEAVLDDDDLKREIEVPFGKGEDRAEGITMLDDKSVLVVFDAPADERKTGDHGVRADIFGLSE